MILATLLHKDIIYCLSEMILDVIKAKKPVKILSAKWLVTVVIIALFSALFAYAKTSLNTVELPLKELLISTVKQGDINVSVEGYGKLISAKLQLITTRSQATVEEIVLKPGARVTKESIIVKLANPELQQQVDSAQQQLEQLRANLRQLVVNQKREQLNEEAKFAELDSIYETAKLRRVAQEKLVESGIVSQLSFKESLLNEKQLNKRMVILAKRVSQLTLVHQEAINILQERIKQQQGQLNVAIERLDKLEVKAGFDGVLQRLSVRLGESLSPGQEIALIGSVTDLIALIQVPQNQAQHVQIGQKVEVDTRLDKIIGTIVRIDPIVQDNTVEVEISLPKTLPKSARPQQNIDASILIETLKNIHYIERPANINALSNVALFKLNTSSTLAEKVVLALGKKAGRYIEIQKGSALGDRFIISDLSNYQVQQLTIN